MANRDIKWLQKARAAARHIIQSYYPDELQFFDPVWETVSSVMLHDILLLESGQLTIESDFPTISEISISGGNNLALVCDPVSRIFMETSFIIDRKKPNKDELQDIIASAAARHGAKPSLTACLIKELPTLFDSLLNLDVNSPQALIHEVPRPMYRVWTELKDITINDEVFEEYEKNKKQYLFWIDLDVKKSRSHLVKGKSIGQTAIRLLKYLVESLGSHNDISDVLMNVFDDQCDDPQISEDRRLKINKQLSLLDIYSGKKFNEYLFDNKYTHGSGIGLKLSFSDKYFLYKQLR